MHEKAGVAICFVLILSIVAGCAATGPTAAKPRETSPSAEEELADYKYLLYLPQDYGNVDKRWPLILFLHGAGERGDDLARVEVHGPPKIVKQGGHFEFIVVSPQCPRGLWWNDKKLMELLDKVIASHSVDTDRLYLTGLSMGGFGTWQLASEYPNKFAAIVPICGGGKPERTVNLKNVPVWVFHGAKDPAVAIAKSEEMVNALRECGGDVKFTVYPDAGHDSWTETYDNPELYEWFLEHRK